MVTGNNSKNSKHFMDRSYSPENAEYLISRVFEDLSQLDSIVSNLPKTDTDGFSDYIPQSEFYIQKNELIKQLASYRRILHSYQQAVNRAMRTIRNNSERIKKDQKQLNSLSVQNIYIDSLSGLYDQYNRHKEAKGRINNTLHYMQRTVENAVAKKMPKIRPPDPDFLEMTANTAFKMEARGNGRS